MFGSNRNNKLFPEKKREKLIEPRFIAVINDLYDGRPKAMVVLPGGNTILDANIHKYIKED